MRKIYLTNSRTHEKKADKVAQRLGKVRLEVVKDWMRQRNITLPVLWATQKEVKGKIRVAQEKDELAAIQHLAQ